jgi:glycosyltransferase involved in cell wall biosynthesis
MDITFISTGRQKFALRDLNILQNNHNVNSLFYNNNSKIRYIKNVKNSVKKSHLIFCWFAGWHSLPAIYYAKRYHKKSLVIAGGFDVAYAPEIGYGAFTNFKERLPAKYVLQNADMVLAVSKSNEKELLDRVTPKRHAMIYNGIPIDRFYPSKKKKEQIVITIGGVTQSTLKKKGLEIFVKVAKELPDIPFLLIGNHGDNSINYLKKIASKNVIFTGFVEYPELLNYCQKAKVYAQLSYHESFGVSVAEAMLCECIPVVTNNYSLPEVVGNTGFLTTYDKVEETVDNIKESLKAPKNKGLDARKYIIENFSLKKREKKLNEIIESL